MSEKENFLKRWSKRKLAERERSTLDVRAANEDPAAREEPTADVETAAPAPPKNDDNAAIKEHTPEVPTLPPLDSIGAGSDIAAFLRPGVPAELTRAALRRAWTSDPAIRDFVGLVENGWDFNDPVAMAGFGPISAQEVTRLVKLIGEVAKPAATEPAAAETPVIERSPDSALSPALETTTRDDASEACSDKEKENDAAQQKDVP
jgi:hypothetical protein